MKQSPVGELDFALAWFLYFISATIGGMLMGFVAGLLVGAMLGFAGVGLDAIRVVCTLVGFVLSLPISYIAFRLIVGKFIVEKLKEVTPEQPSLVPPLQ